MILTARPLIAAALVFVLALTGAEAKPKPEPVHIDLHTIVVTGYRAEITDPGKVVAAWTQYGPGGVLEARAVMVGRYCPMLALDLKQTPMRPRATSDDKFATVCAAVIPSGTKQAALAFKSFHFRTPYPDRGTPAEQRQWIAEEYGLSPDTDLNGNNATAIIQAKLEEKTTYTLLPLPVPVSDPQRILILGDTGCRIKGMALQDCSSPSAWPFPRIAAEAAKLKPDLVIHVGDYLYRENACPADFKGCQGTPFGDNWPTWDADFFAPAKPLLAAAPWVIVRGNHEDCSRAGSGFLRLLGPNAYDPASVCADHLVPYSIPFDALNLVVGDDANAPETSVAAAAVPAYRTEIANLAKEKGPTWWLQHRPIWGVISGPLGIPGGGNLTLMAALGDSGIPAPVELMVSGHIHAFQVFNYDGDKRVPPQLVAGHGGDNLDATPANLHGSIFLGSSGVGVKDGLSIGGFGFVLMTRNAGGWRMDVYDWQGSIIRVCQFHNGRIDCPVIKR